MNLYMFEYYHDETGAISKAAIFASDMVSAARAFGDNIETGLLLKCELENDLERILLVPHIGDEIIDMADMRDHEFVKIEVVP